MPPLTSHYTPPRRTSRTLWARRMEGERDISFWTCWWKLFLWSEVLVLNSFLPTPTASFWSILHILLYFLFAFFEFVYIFNVQCCSILAKNCTRALSLFAKTKAIKLFLILISARFFHIHSDTWAAHETRAHTHTHTYMHCTPSHSDTLTQTRTQQSMRHRQQSCLPDGARHRARKN